MSVGSVNTNGNPYANQTKSEPKRNVVEETEAFDQARADRLTISEEARRLAELARLERKGKYGFTKDDLSAVKKRFAKLTQMRSDLDGSFKSILSKNQITLDPLDQAKIEIDSKGRAVVGGIKNAATARKLERALNADKGFMEQLRTFRETESSVSKELESVSGSSLHAYSDMIADAQMSGDADFLRNDLTLGEYADTDLIQLKDQPIYQVDEEFAGMISSYFAKSVNADFSGRESILESADATVDGAVRGVMEKVTSTFAAMNKTLSEEMKGTLSHEELAKRMVRLDNLKVSVDEEGRVIIEGRACANLWRDFEAKDAIKALFAQELATNPMTGKQHNFTLAAKYLLNQYDNGPGKGDKERHLEVSYENGKVESRIYSPEKEEALRESIASEARAALGESGVDATGLELAVDDEGKLVVANPPEGPKGQIVRSLVESLNKQVEERSLADVPEDEETEEKTDEESETSGGAVDRLRQLLARLDVHLAGGTKKLLSYDKPGGDAAAE